MEFIEIFEKYLGLNPFALLAILIATIFASRGFYTLFNLSLARQKFIVSSAFYVVFFILIAIIENPGLNSPGDFARLIFSFVIGYLSATGIYDFIKPKAPVEVITYKK